jgi:Flp pilus assembly pilin Flp
MSLSNSSPQPRLATHLGTTEPKTQTKTQAPRARQHGQGMTEYIIIVALVAVAAIAVYQSFGRVIRSQTAAIASELAGESSRNAISNAGKAASEANKQLKNKSLKNYGAKSR